MRLRFGLIGRERVESNFRLDRMVSHTEEVYFGVLRE